MMLNPTQPVCFTAGEAQGQIEISDLSKTLSCLSWCVQIYDNLKFMAKIYHVCKSVMMSVYFQVEAIRCRIHEKITRQSQYYSINS